ncbi:MAG: hypothetical protein Q6L58_01915 [Thermostichales cyanobacterium BF3_bins_165]
MWLLLIGLVGLTGARTATLPQPVAMIVLQEGIPRPADAQGHVPVQVNTPYELEFRCPLYASAVDVKIDELQVMRGLVCQGRVRLQRPQHLAKSFVVLPAGDPGLGLDGGRSNPNLGLIEATFRPLRPRLEQSTPILPAGESASRRAVGTGLGPDSGQQFRPTTAWIPAPGLAPVRTVRLRLRGIREPLVIEDPVLPQL